MAKQRTSQVKYPKQSPVDLYREIMHRFEKLANHWSQRLPRMPRPCRARARPRYRPGWARCQTILQVQRLRRRRDRLPSRHGQAARNTGHDARHRRRRRVRCLHEERDGAIERPTPTAAHRAIDLRAQRVRASADRRQEKCMMQRREHRLASHRLAIIDIDSPASLAIP